ncbi:MAG: phosphoribosylformylglycinamidine synthase subunit PurS [Deltaproteobacteria bacterium]|nr:phosphoribosylformylglycinamidine synthase subunit PurS [Deltaproteobacteria bacterium]
MRATVHVSLKEGVLDPQGKAVGQALGRLGFDEVSEVRLGRTVNLELEAKSEAEARERLVEMCEKLLANTVIEDYRIELGED